MSREQAGISSSKQQHERRKWAPFSKWRLDKKRVGNKEMGIRHQ
jgi:hypothetical protein